jgi:hypothetical protein
LLETWLGFVTETKSEMVYEVVKKMIAKARRKYIGWD